MNWCIFGHKWQTPGNESICLRCGKYGYGRKYTLIDKIYDTLTAFGHNNNIMQKTYGNTDSSKAKKNVKDIKFWPAEGFDGFKLIGKAWSKAEGWMKSTKAMEVPGQGCLVQVTTQQGENVSEALTYAPMVKIQEGFDDNGNVIGRQLLSVSDNTHGKKKEKKVFLGGTCAESTWRDEIIPLLNYPFFDPVVDDWTPECIEEENRQKEICAVHLYVITKEMSGVYSIAEVIDSCYCKGVTTLFSVIPDGFEEPQLRSLQAVGEMVSKRGGVVCFGDVCDIAESVNFLLY